MKDEATITLVAPMNESDADIYRKLSDLIKRERELVEALRNMTAAAHARRAACDCYSLMSGPCRRCRCLLVAENKAYELLEGTR